jgi:hypothetical protein
MEEDEYRGIITDIYKDRSNHYVYTFSIITENDIFEVNAEMWPYSWKYASIGDSIIKIPGELRMIIKKEDGSSKSFYYR